MNSWDGTSWDKGYEAGRKAGLEEAHRYQHQCNADLATRAKLREEGRELEQERILAMKKKIINCVIDYGLTPEKYERICNDIDALIKGEK